MNGRNDSKNIAAPELPTLSTKSPLAAAVTKHSLNSCTFDSEFFSRRYKIGPAIDADAFAAKNQLYSCADNLNCST